MPLTLGNCSEHCTSVPPSSIFGPAGAYLPGSPSPSVAFVAGCLHFVPYNFLFVCFVTSSFFPLGWLVPYAAKGLVLHVLCLQVPLLFYPTSCCFLALFACTSCFCIFLFVFALVSVVTLPAVLACAAWVSATSLAKFRLPGIVFSGLSRQSSSDAVWAAGSALCVCVPCALVFCVFVLVLLSSCLCVFPLWAGVVRAAWVSATSLAKFRLPGIVFSGLSRHSPSGAVRPAAGSCLSLCLVFCSAHTFTPFVHTAFCVPV